MVSRPIATDQKIRSQFGASLLISLSFEVKFPAPAPLESRKSRKNSSPVMVATEALKVQMPGTGPAG